MLSDFATVVYFGKESLDQGQRRYKELADFVIQAMVLDWVKVVDVAVDVTSRWRCLRRPLYDKLTRQPQDVAWFDLIVASEICTTVSGLFLRHDRWKILVCDTFNT